jgi:hypothetical protein
MDLFSVKFAISAERSPNIPSFLENHGRENPSLRGTHRVLNGSG